MKQLILDYLRRKSVVLFAGALLEFVVGLISGIHEENNQHPLASLQIQIGIFLGPFLLSIDLGRGIARAVATLPLTARQIGRAWWFATVAIPAALFSALLFAGAGVICLIRPSTVIDWNWVVLASIYLFLWMGTTFTLVFAMGTSSLDGVRRRVLNISAAVFWVFMITGSMVFLLSGGSDQWGKIVCALAVGAVLTVVGWFFTERLVAARMGFRLGTQTASQKRGPVQLPGGYGGIPLLISTTLTRSLLMGMAMMVVMGLVFFMQAGVHYDWRGGIKTMLGMGFFPFWFIVFFGLIPVLTQLRYLRSLPITATNIAVVMMTVMLLPLMIMGGLAAGAVGSFIGAPEAIRLVSVFLLVVPPVAIVLVFFTWLGNATFSYLLMIVLLMVMQFVSMFYIDHNELSLTMVASIAIASVLLCAWLTRLALMRSGKVYRAQANVFGNSAYWQARG